MRFSIKQLPLLSLTAAIVMLTSCGQKQASDPCCTTEDIGGHAKRDSEQAMLRVQGTTTANFYVFNEAGEQVAYELLNRSIALPEGKYTVKVNNHPCTVDLKEGTMVTCATGTLIVAGSTGENYYVMDPTNHQLGFEVLGKQMSFFPGAFKVKVNNTVTTVNITPRAITEVRSGALVVHGSTDEYYYVLDTANHQLNYNRLEKPLAFLPGTYPVKINNSTLSAQVEANKLTELATGCVLVRGLTDEYYYVSDTVGHALNYQSLNKALALFPGKVSIKINNTLTVANIMPADTTEFLTGSIMLTGAGTEYYYVLDEQGNQLNYNSLNKSLSFFPSEYTIRLGRTTRKATVVAGQLTSMDAFN